ncbi:TatD family hydrolase [Ructibacterium gallinarum]|uniref:TatD family hydrolase n=1 Tax=Ructibacterium gallinarum TaxID=2779355 RepID=A0A9D5R8H7_9FIRM|nr:TatD family hydrolase [Ructibacterium gallinarum]MBE5039972.1 TatD family hydrolase [Ructibacterium gallinarum]
MLFDTHAHYDDARFDEDREQVIASLADCGVGYVMNIGADMETSRRAVDLADRYDFFYASVGVHPSDVENLTQQDMETLKRMAMENPKVRAIGEIGLDYHYDTPEPEVQKKWLIRQLQLAQELDMPVVIHDRESKGQCIEILRQMKISKGVMHCFSGSAQTAKELVKMGFMISFTGVLTFKNARKAVEACAAVPIDRLMIETDCPYMAPEPHRGERNYSGYVKYVAQKMAEIKGVSYEEMVRITTENALRFYRIEK